MIEASLSPVRYWLACNYDGCKEISHSVGGIIVDPDNADKLFRLAMENGWAVYSTSYTQGRDYCPTHAPDVAEHGHPRFYTPPPLTPQDTP